MPEMAAMILSQRLRPLHKAAMRHARKRGNI
jgi:hypothetical protein